MITILTKYFAFKIVYVGILIAGYIYYKKGKVSLLIVSIISLLTVAALINDFYAPSLNSNIRTYNKIKNLEAEHLESIDIISNDYKKTISSKKQLQWFAELVRQTRVYHINSPRYIQEYELILNLKGEGEIIKLIVVELDTDESIFRMMNSFNNQYYEIATFENPEIHLWLINALKK